MSDEFITKVEIKKDMGFLDVLIGVVLVIVGFGLILFASSIWILTILGFEVKMVLSGILGILAVALVIYGQNRARRG